MRSGHSSATESRSADGCGWGRCVFCSDVTTANGRTFRSRPVDDVLDELEVQAQRYATRDVIFLDIKLNSELRMWRAIADSFQDRLPGGHWIGTSADSQQRFQAAFAVSKSSQCP